MYLIEKNHVENIIKITQSIVNEIYKEDLETFLIDKIYTLLEQVTIDDHRLYKLKLNLYLILCIKGNYLLTLPKLIDFMILANRTEEFLIIHELAEDHAFKEMMELFLTERNDFTIVKENLFFQRFKLFEKKKIGLQLIKKGPSRETIINTEDLDESFEVRNTSSDKPAVRSTYKLADEEKILINRYKKKLLPVSEDIIVAFIMLGYFSLAEQLADGLDDCSKKNYFKVAILFEMQRYTDVIIEANSIITDDLDVTDVIPLEIFKFKSFMALGDSLSASKCQARINTLDPNHLII